MQINSQCTIYTRLLPIATFCNNIEQV